MVTTIDTKLRDKADSVLATYGKDLTFAVRTKTYDPTTGATTYGAATNTVVKGSPPGPYERRFVDGDVVRLSDARTIVAAKNLTFTPTIGIKVSFDSTDWQVVSARPMYSGEQVAAWELQLRR